MAINTVFTRGFGNGSFAGSVNLVVTRGYAILTPVVRDSSAEVVSVVLDLFKVITVDDAKAALFINDVSRDIIV